MSKKQQELADVLEEYSTYLELDGQKGRATGYDRASRAIRTAPYLAPDPSQMDGVGDSIRTTIAKYQRSGEIEELEDLKEQYAYFDELKKVSHVGPARAKQLHDKLRVDDVNDLILRGDDVQMLDGVGPKTQEKIMRSARRIQE